MNLNQKIALVTGAAHGIGRATALALAEHGADVVLADIAGDDNAAAAEDIAGATDRQTLAVTCDVGRDAELEALLDATLARFGRCDILVNNAGIVAAGDILDLDPADFDRVLGVNLRAYFRLTQLVARQMVEQNLAGAIINISSINAELAIPNQLAYVCSKGGVQQLTKACALRLAEHGIRVNAIGPGSILTDVLRSVMHDEAARRKILSRTPLGRIGDPAEIGRVAVFLASDYASYITGQTIFPDGGRLALNYTVPVAD